MTALGCSHIPRIPWDQPAPYPVFWAAVDTHPPRCQVCATSQLSKRWSTTPIQLLKLSPLLSSTALYANDWWLMRFLVLAACCAKPGPIIVLCLCCMQCLEEAQNYSLSEEKKGTQGRSLPHLERWGQYPFTEVHLSRWVAKQVRAAFSVKGRCYQWWLQTTCSVKILKCWLFLQWWEAALLLRGKEMGLFTAPCENRILETWFGECLF